MSPRGELVGHRLTGMEWLAVARASLAGDMQIQEETALGVHHAIHACHAPAWVGLRSPKTLEALYFGSVDGLSGKRDLIAALAVEGESKSGYQKAFGGSIYLNTPRTDLQ